MAVARRQGPCSPLHKVSKGPSNKVGHTSLRKEDHQPAVADRTLFRMEENESPPRGTPAQAPFSHSPIPTWRRGDPPRCESRIVQPPAPAPPSAAKRRGGRGGGGSPGTKNHRTHSPSYRVGGRGPARPLICRTPAPPWRAKNAEHPAPPTSAANGGYHSLAMSPRVCRSQHTQCQGCQAEDDFWTN
ncbi:hypothetical protein GWK47_025630 [Chionoecetes opilio]|uniref:Uncharacterized protein n=1 Tax=Chionoecetes opilio TaxID=41210 RepID=A0A8J8WDN2_CHIOP|nr:hypothetical protein GWK47_025630 [Chionoecetes opilio]